MNLKWEFEVGEDGWFRWVCGFCCRYWWFGTVRETEVKEESRYGWIEVESSFLRHDDHV